MKTYLTSAISSNVAVYTLYCGLFGGYWHPLVAIFLLALTVNHLEAKGEQKKVK
jgi:hypothetical protein